MPDPADPAPFPAARANARAANLKRARNVLAHAKDASGRAGRPALRRVVAGATRAMRAEAKRLAAGTIAPAEWFRRSADALVVRHYAAALALNGGRTPTPDALDALDDAVNRQAGLLARMRGQLEAIPTTKALVARAANYGRAVWATAMNVQRAGMADSAAQEHRHMGASERHCGECPSLEAMGWRPAGTLPEIGDTPCSTGCHCYFTYRGARAARRASDDARLAASRPRPPTVAGVEAALGVRFARAYNAADDEVVVADLGRLMASLAGDAGPFVGPGGTGAAKPGAYGNVLAFLAHARATGTPVEMPRVGLDAAGNATVIDGRHRLAAFEALGAHGLPVTVDPADAAAFRRLFGER